MGAIALKKTQMFEETSMFQTMGVWGTLLSNPRNIVIERISANNLPETEGTGL
jgi:hypothetical protein